jgi:hypothetical protein
MDDNLLSLAKQALGGDFTRMAGPVSRRIRRRGPSSLGALLPASSAASPRSARRRPARRDLLARINESGIDPGMLGNLGSLFAGGGTAATGLMKTGMDLAGASSATRAAHS